MIPDWLTPTILTIVTASTPLVFAAIGEIVAEKAGVLNLGSLEWPALPASHLQT